MNKFASSDNEQSIPRIIYIAGNGRSGSTLLDLVLGNNPDCFSAGELTFISRDGILAEYCGCGSPIGSCQVWREIIELWESMQPVGISEYRRLRHRYELNRTLPRLMANLVKPSREFRAYCAATEALFNAIQEVTKAGTIIDSSKTPGRIRILARFSDLTVVHLCRNFSGVLNSMSKGVRKNLEEGVEVDLHATSPGKTLLIWTLNNILVEVLSIGLNRRRIHYRDLVANTDDVLRTVDGRLGHKRGDPIAKNHMLAGNKMRLKSNMTISPDIGFLYKNLSRGLGRFGVVIDRIFWFWSKT